MKCTAFWGEIKYLKNSVSVLFD